ncbi:segregation/condensation protein A [Leeia sp. TBRC 13508]|uniref:Segregation and condensation protein A n=1 Tax=Leeia speluncae TaxID=2884804 RepID=A0ABS8DBQ6_9NEIS|nr:ScpA family protein [Leeia speluncae]MCB6185351.1 segregation/condensation protein A [Leeia speluncae]
MKQSDLTLPQIDLPEPPIAQVNGEAVREFPADLYIPPDALQVFLETFEGPLDLLLYLIRKQNLDVLNIPMAQLTEQYMAYVAMMENHRFELASEYLLMAAMLIEIKSRLLLPVPPSLDDQDEYIDPRAALVERLLVYEQMKAAALVIDQLPIAGDAFEWAQVLVDSSHEILPPEVDVAQLIEAWQRILKRNKLQTHHHVAPEVVSIRHQMAHILKLLKRQTGPLDFDQFFEDVKNKMQLVLNFIAILELAKEGLVRMIQTEPNGTIYVVAPNPP